MRDRRHDTSCSSSISKYENAYSTEKAFKDRNEIRPWSIWLVEVHYQAGSDDQRLSSNFQVVFPHPDLPEVSVLVGNSLLNLCSIQALIRQFWRPSSPNTRDWWFHKYTDWWGSPSSQALGNLMKTVEYCIDGRSSSRWLFRFADFTIVDKYIGHDESDFSPYATKI
jgi:hypothetical protein